MPSVMMMVEGMIMVDSANKNDSWCDGIVVVVMMVICPTVNWLADDA